MLEELVIRDYAIIDKLSVRFEPGLNLLSGETGAGKSILIGALGFLLGARADTGIIRAEAEEALVSAVFSVSGNSESQKWLENHDLMSDDGNIIIRRGLKRTGRGSSYVQDIPVSRAELQELAASIIEIHGQRDGLALLKKEKQRELLDLYAGLTDELGSYSLLYQELSIKRRALDSMLKSAADRERESELLKFAIEEIAAAAPKTEEENELLEEERLLSQYEKLYSAVSQAHELLSDSEGIVARARKAKQLLETATAIDSRLSDEARRFSDAYYELDDLGGIVGSYLGRLGIDPDRLEEIEARLALLQKLKRKYGDSIAEVLDYRKEAESKLSSIEHWDEDREKLGKDLARLEELAHKAAEKISASRNNASLALDAAIQGIIATLGMPHARFKTRLDRISPNTGKVVLGPFGYDEVEFYVSANKGEPLRALSDVASGGELSRIMLALKTVIAGDTPTLIFDEIDTGIGGEVALSVGRHLAELSANRQILCISHLASLAARADNHLMVVKKLEGNRTVTRIEQLGNDNRVREIARMLSGDSGSKASLEHAAELITKLKRMRG